MKKALFLILLAAFCSRAAVQEFQIDQDRLWLTANNEPLPDLLQHFAAAGVDVQIDPNIRKMVSGVWKNEDMEVVLQKILSPSDYLLDWRRESGPLGSWIRLTGIQVFHKGDPGSARPLLTNRRIEQSVDGAHRFFAREILVAFGPNSTMDDLRALLSRTGGSIIAANEKLGVYRLLLPPGTNIPDLAAQLDNDERIAFAEPNYIYDLPKTSIDPSAATVDQWDAPQGDRAISVAVLDSGLTPDTSLSAAVINSFDATDPDAPLVTDAVGHGTLMARLAAGQLDPYARPVGEGVPVVAIKAFADDGSADSFTLMNAMTYAVENSAGPLSLSWGSETPSPLMKNAINYAVASGQPIFAAVGNENTGRPMYPAAYPGVIGIAAGTEGGQYTDYSNRGDFVDLIAPGSAGGSQGTSVATAYIAHVAAQYMRHHPGADVKAALIDAAGPDRYLSAEEVLQLLNR